MKGRDARTTTGCATALDRQKQVGARDARKLRVVKWRPPDRFVSERAGWMLRVPVMVRTVRAPTGIRRAQMGITCGREAFSPAHRDAIRRCPGRDAEQRGEEQTAEHDPIVTRVPDPVNHRDASARERRERRLARV